MGKERNTSEFTINSHFYELFDQEWDSTNMTESWSTYDEAFWPEMKNGYDVETEPMAPWQIDRIKALMESQGLDWSKRWYTQLMTYEEAQELIETLSNEEEEWNRFREQEEDIDALKEKLEDNGSDEDNLFIDDETYAQMDRAVNRSEEEEEAWMFWYEYSEEAFGTAGDEDLFKSRNSDFD